MDTQERIATAIKDIKGRYLNLSESDWETVTQRSLHHLNYYQVGHIEPMVEVFADETNREILFKHTHNQKVRERVAELLGGIYNDMNEIVEMIDGDEDWFCDCYPFTDSFDEVSARILEWRAEMLNYGKEWWTK